MAASQVTIGGAATGSTTPLPVASTIDGANDYLAIYTASATATQAINRNTLLGITSQVADISSVQTFTNKVMGNTNTYTALDGSFTMQHTGSTTKQVKFSLTSITAGQTRTITIPDVSDTMVLLGATQTLTSKTLTSPTINSATIATSTITGATISNPTLTVDTISGYTVGGNVTIGGVAISSGTITTTGAVIAGTVASSAIVPNSLLSGTGASWPAQTWSPTWTNLSVGNGIQQATYVQIGKTVIVNINLKFGTTTSVSGSLSVNLPVTAAVSNFPAGDAEMLGVCYFGISNGYTGVVRMSSTTAVVPLCINTASTYATQAGVDATHPDTFATGSSLTMYFSYQAA